MQCADFDWKGFVLGETPPPERRAMEKHLDTCPACRREVEALGLTLAALRQLPPHPVPRRLAFVSDPVFGLPWWKRLGRLPAPAWGFASALVVAAAILVHAQMAAPPAPAPGAAEARAIARAVEAELERRLPVAVEAAVRQQLAPAAAQLELRLAEFEKRLEAQRRADLRDVAAAFELLQKRINNVYLASAQYGGD